MVENERQPGEVDPSEGEKSYPSEGGPSAPSEDDCEVDPSEQPRGGNLTGPDPWDD